MKALIADECPEVTGYLVTIMEEIPHVEILAPTYHAQTTLSPVRAHDPEVVIVDARIPGGKRTDLLRTIRREKPHATLIILTHLAYTEYSHRLNGEGEAIFMDKGREYIFLSQFATLSGRTCSVWVKFSCGEFRVLDTPVDRGLEKLGSVLGD